MAPTLVLRTLACRIALACLEHLQQNHHGALTSDDPEYIHQMRGHRQQPVIVHRVQAVHLRPAARGLADALCEQRVVLAQEGADDEGAVQLGQRGDRGAEPASSSTR